jgi:hypothetical protein
MGQNTVRGEQKSLWHWSIKNRQIGGVHRGAAMITGRWKRLKKHDVPLCLKGPTGRPGSVRFNRHVKARWKKMVQHSRKKSYPGIIQQSQERPQRALVTAS